METENQKDVFFSEAAKKVFSDKIYTALSFALGGLANSLCSPTDEKQKADLKQQLSVKEISEISIRTLREVTNLALDQIEKETIKIVGEKTTPK